MGPMQIVSAQAEQEETEVTPERYNELMCDDTAKLSHEEMAAGWHFCPDWDDLLVGPGMPEAEECGALNKQDLSDSEYMFAQDASGKLYRGAKLWQWTRNWRRAAVMTVRNWKSLQEVGAAPADVRFVTLSELLECK